MIRLTNPGEAGWVTRPWEEVEPEVRGAVAAGREVVLGGGEPTRSPHLLRVLRALSAGGVDVAMITDAAALASDARLDALARAGLAELQIAFFGTGAAHDAIVGSVGAYRHSLRAAALAAKRGVPRLVVRFSVSSANAGQLDGVFDVAVALRARGFVLALGHLGDAAALAVLEAAVARGIAAGVHLRAEGFDACVPDGLAVRAVDAGLVAIGDMGLPVPARGGTWGGDVVGDIEELGLALAGWKVPALDLPPCLGGHGEGSGLKVEACAPCPAVCGGLPPVLRRWQDRLAPRREWSGVGPGSRVAVVCGDVDDPILREQTFPGLIRDLKARGVAVAVGDAEAVEPWEVDLTVVSDLHTGRALVERCGPIPLLAVDFHMLDGMAAWAERWGEPGARPSDGGWWPGPEVRVLSCFPGYNHLYRAYGVPLAQVGWRPYTLDAEAYPVGADPRDCTSIFCGGNHRRDWRTLEEAVRALPGGVHPMDVFTPEDVGLDGGDLLRHRGFVPLPAFWEAIRSSRFAVVPLVPDRNHAAGMTVMALAHAAGRPVIATWCAGSVDHLRDGVDSLLVRAGDPAALAEAIERLDTDPALLDRLSAGAREAARKQSTAAWAEEIVEGVRPARSVPAPGAAGAPWYPW